MDYRTYLMEQDEAEYERQLAEEREERERAEEEAACAAADAADQAEDAAWEAAGVCPFPYRRIETRPVRLVETAQGRLFTEVA